MLNMASLFIGIELWKKRTLLNKYKRLADATADACGPSVPEGLPRDGGLVLQLRLLLLLLLQLLLFQLQQLLLLLLLTTLH